MTMKEKVARKQTELLEYHLANGVIDIRKLKNGTHVEVQTPDENYELEVGTANKGVVLIASDGRFGSREKAIVVGSIDPDTRILLPHIIGQGLVIFLRPEKLLSVQTGPVISARILGRKDSYTYEMWSD